MDEICEPLFLVGNFTNHKATQHLPIFLTVQCMQLKERAHIRGSTGISHFIAVEYLCVIGQTVTERPGRRDSLLGNWQHTQRYDKDWMNWDPKRLYGRAFLYQHDSCFQQIGVHFASQHWNKNKWRWHLTAGFGIVSTGKLIETWPRLINNNFPMKCKLLSVSFWLELNADHA